MVGKMCIFAGRMGVIIRDEFCPGVFRGQLDVWFGKSIGDMPVIVSVPKNRVTLIDSPLGEDHRTFFWGSDNNRIV
jgi:hypothetical protein